MGVFNCERYVAGAVESVLRQTYGDFEFIIIDDGSSDGSLEVLKRMQAKDARIQLISRPNKGLVGTSNELIERARGGYFAVMDHDDLMRPNCIAREVEHLDRHPGCVAVSGDNDYIDDDDNVIFRSRKPRHSCELNYRQFPPKFPHLAHSGSMLRLDAVRKIGGYRNLLRHGVDGDMWIRLIKQGTLDHLDETLLLYRWHSTNTSRKSYWETLDAAIVWRLSAVCGELGINDSSPLRDYASRGDFKAASVAYENILNGKFPVSTYIMWCKLALRMSPICPGGPSMTELGRELIKHVLSWPPSPAKMALARIVTAKALETAYSRVSRLGTRSSPGAIRS